MKFTLLLNAFLFSLSCFAQEEQIAPINTIEQAKILIQVHPELDGQIWTTIPETHATDTSNVFTSKKKGAVFSDENRVFKVLNTQKTNAHRVSYIYLDRSKLSMEAINALRKTILEKYKAGTPFTELANEYTMDHNKTGDLNWFKDGTMVPLFEKAVKKHKVNDIFIVDIPENKWYYVTLKTFQDKELEELTLLSVKKKK